MAKDNFTARVGEIEVTVSMSVPNKSGIWVKPSVGMKIMVEGITTLEQRSAIVKQAFEEDCDNIEKVISEME